MGHKESKVIEKKDIPQKYPIDIPTRIQSIERDQNETATFNIGGKIFKIGLSTLEDSKYGHNIFKALHKYNPQKEIFIDRSFEQFDTFLQILRYSIPEKSLRKSEAYPFAKAFQKRIVNKDIFRADLKFYFQEDFDQVVEDFALNSIIDFKNSNSLIEDYELINSNPDERLDFMFYRARDIKEIFNTYCCKGFFCLTEGGIIVKLSKVTRITRIEMKPFLHDKMYWNEDMCPKIQVYGTINKDKWNYLGIINLLSKDDENISNLCMISTAVKCIKLCAEEGHYFSIAYLKLF